MNHAQSRRGMLLHSCCKTSMLDHQLDYKMGLMPNRLLGVLY
ncbi:MAG: hypothetical protein ACJA1U_002678 [Bermanella sp.]|jgi:hypothetical protein